MVTEKPPMPDGLLRAISLAGGEYWKGVPHRRQVESQTSRGGTVRKSFVMSSMYDR
jgi:hypothetical protein